MGKPTKKAPENTPDIRGFFFQSPKKSHQPTASDSKVSISDNESPINKKKDEKMPGKRKRIATYLVDSSTESDEDVIMLKKKSKKAGDEKSKTKKSTTKRKTESDSENDYKPKSKKSTSKKRVESDSFDDSEDDYEQPKAKKSKATKKSTSKPKDTATKSKATKSKAAKSKATKGFKGTLVKPLEAESSEDENAVDCTIVKKEANTLAGFEMQLINGKKAKLNEKSLMWVDKYKPKTIKDIIGQHTPKSNANALKNWLINWEKNKDVKVKFGAKNDAGLGLRACLLSGLPGIGKTTTATLVAKECGYDYIEMNASDARNKRSMDDHVKTLLSNKSLSGYFQNPNHETELSSKHLLIMDEVDGMGGNADRGGIKELIQFIRKTKIPIICICNDRSNIKIRNLANYCFDLKFSKIRVPQITNYINSVCQKENVKIDPKLLEEIIEMSNRDIRQILHYVSVFSQKVKNISNTQGNKQLIKTKTLNIFDCVHTMFTDSPEYQAMSFRDKSYLFFNDYQMMPLMAFENYIQCKPSASQTGAESLTRALKSIDAMCLGDIVSTEIRTNQTWNLLPLQAAFSCVLPGYYMNGHFNGKIEFANWFGKLSSTNKKGRLITELKQHMNLKVTGSKECLNLDYVLPLRERIIRPLINKEEEAVSSAIKTLSHYCLLKDDLDSIIELSLWYGEKSPYAVVDTKTKSALTRNYNNLYNPLPYVFKDMFKKVGAKDKAKKKDDDDDEDDEEEKVFQDDELIPEF